MIVGIHAFRTVDRGDASVRRWPCQTTNTDTDDALTERVRVWDSEGEAKMRTVGELLLLSLQVHTCCFL